MSLVLPLVKYAKSYLVSLGNTSRDPATDRKNTRAFTSADPAGQGSDLPRNEQDVRTSTNYCEPHKSVPEWYWSPHWKDYLG